MAASTAVMMSLDCCVAETSVVAVISTPMLATAVSGATETRPVPETPMSDLTVVLPGTGVGPGGTGVTTPAVGVAVAAWAFATFGLIEGATTANSATAATAPAATSTGIPIDLRFIVGPPPRTTLLRNFKDHD